MASTTKGSIYFNEGDLLGASINRSPTAYLKNSEEERRRQVATFSQIDPVHVISVNL